MNGWKTILSAALSVAYGVGGYALGLHDPSTMMAFVSAGIGTLGLGHKLDKNTEAVQEASSTDVSLANKTVEKLDHLVAK